jgi:hypothetical protein
MNAQLAGLDQQTEHLAFQAAGECTAAELAGDTFAKLLPDSPYPGFRPFEQSEWPIFFGRERDTRNLIERLASTHFICVHGVSGSGKSSLMHAGVVTTLQREHARRGVAWKTVVFRPGRTPLWNLATGMVSALNPDQSPNFDLVLRTRSLLGRPGASIAKTVGELGVPPLTNLLLIADQFEELFRYRDLSDADEAQRLVELLLAVMDQQPSGLYAVLVMRSDFIGDSATRPGLAEVINETSYLVPPLFGDELRSAICSPIELYGGRIQPALADQIIADSATELDQLPLVQHVLMRLWATRIEYEEIPASGAIVITLDDYKRIGGISKALSRHANEVYERLIASTPFPRTEVANAVEYIFRALTAIDQGRAVRCPQHFSQIVNMVPGKPELAASIVKYFQMRECPFLRLQYGSLDDERAIVDITHEALLRRWDRMAEREVDPATGLPRGWLYKEFHEGLIWRALAVQARNKQAILDPATTAQRWPFWQSVCQRPAWAVRYFIDPQGCASPEDEPEWQQVQRLMTVSYERWQEELKRLETVQKSADNANADVARLDRRIKRRWRPAVAVSLFATAVGVAAATAGYQLAQQRLQEYLGQVRIAEARLEEVTQANAASAQALATTQNLLNEITRQAALLETKTDDPRATMAVAANLNQVVKSTNDQVNALNQEFSVINQEVTDQWSVSQFDATGRPGSEGYIWISNENRPGIGPLQFLSDDGNNRLRADEIKQNQVYTVTGKLHLRAAVPTQVDPSPKVLGTLPRGSRVRVIEAPTASPSVRSPGSILYWAKVRLESTAPS